MPEAHASERNAGPQSSWHCFSGLRRVCGACYRVFTRARKRASNDPKIRRDKANTDAFLQQIRETRQRMEQRQKIRMVTR